jgi:hypothetical protein
LPSKNNEFTPWRINFNNGTFIKNEATQQVAQVAETILLITPIPFFMKNHKPQVSLKFAKQLGQFVIRKAVAAERPILLL